MITAAITSAGTDGRPRPDGNKSSNNTFREQPAAIRGQEREHTARCQQMTRNRLDIQQIPLTLRPSLHTKIIQERVTNRPSHADCSGAS